MLSDLIRDATFQENVVCDTWEELVDICGAPLVAQGSVLPEFLQSVKETILEFGSYMVLLDDIAFFHHVFIYIFITDLGFRITDARFI